MKNKNKKICLLFCGGTILSEKDPVNVKKESDIKEWLSKVPEISIMADIETVFIGGEAEHQSGHELWQKINSEIYKRLEDCDGFIVTNHIYEVLYSAIASSFALANLNKPVIFTSSQLPIVNKELISAKKKTFGGLGIKANIINAMQIATMDFPAVGLMFGNVFMRAVKAQRTAIYTLNIFSSLDNTYLAKIDFGISPQEKIILPKDLPELKNNFKANVISLKYHPGFELDKIKDSLAKCQGLFIDVLEPESLSDNFIKELKDLKLPIVLYNQYFIKKIGQENIIPMYQITQESAIVKFMWALGQAKEISTIRELMINKKCFEYNV